jgi:hypothetical protein
MRSCFSGTLSFAATLPRSMPGQLGAQGRPLMIPDAANRRELHELIGKMPADMQLRMMVDIERGLLSGEDIQDAELTLDLLRGQIRKFGLRPYRIGNPSRWFFAPLEPYLVDGVSARKHSGYISRESLDPIWLWICRDVMPAAALGYSESSRRSLLDNDIDTAIRLANRFQDLAVRSLRPVLQAADREEEARGRLALRNAPACALDDLRHIVAIFDIRKALTTLGMRLPPTISALNGAGLDRVLDLLNRMISTDSSILVYGLIQVMQRLATPAQLVRLAIKATGSNVEPGIARSPYAIAVTLVISHLDMMTSALAADLETRQPDDTRKLLKSIHSALRVVETELDIEHSPSWQPVIDCRAKISAMMAGRANRPAPGPSPGLTA